ncbi:MAG: type I-E CRISPR-associated protein Cse2/CasB [Gemmatimonadaceae bacterium]|nr:type I-E CRISPR-associated protein Cse2/CasB [Gemmatimonadaceae bacterium]MBA3558872.1 type I-E CRISPR-associated protein Cse2/CasB [Gemmatimonadaceae bacterium]
MTEPVTRPEAVPSARKKDTRRDDGEKARTWWFTLTHRERGDRGALAELRRCRSPVDVLGIRPAIALARNLGVTDNSSDDRTRNVLDLARVLARVKEDDPKRRPMRVAGFQKFVDPMAASAKSDEKPVLSETRLARLLRTGEGEEKVMAFARLIALLGGKINVGALASDFLYWNHPAFGDGIRERWAFDYYAAGSAAPDTSNQHNEETEE